MFMLIQGRIHQIEYAMEAVKQGSATVGLKSRTHAVLVALKVKSLNVLSVDVTSSQKTPQKASFKMIHFFLNL